VVNLEIAYHNESSLGKDKILHYHKMIRYGKADIDSEFADVLRQAITSYTESVFDVLRRYECDLLPPPMLTHRGGGFSLNDTSVPSINELTP